MVWRSLRALPVVAVAMLVAVLMAGASPAVAQQEQSSEIDQTVPADPNAPETQVPVENPARVQTGPALDEVVVSASRRDERLQDVPIAVTALNQEALEQREITGVADLQTQVPGLVYAHVAGMSQLTMRGVGTDLYSLASEPGVAIYMDDVYMARIFMSHAAMLELERVEVLRGPQGTLYGRNTSGGAVKFIAKRPSPEFEADAGVQFGSFKQRVGRASVTGPIWSDDVRARASVYWEDMEGWTQNLANNEPQDGRNVLSGRLAVDWDIGASTRLSLSLDAQREDDSGPTLHGLTPVIGTVLSDSLAIPLLSPFDRLVAGLEGALGFALKPLFDAAVATVGGNYSEDPHEIYNDFPPRSLIYTQGVVLTGETDLGFAQAKLIGGWRHAERDYRYDTDGSDLPLLRFNPYYQNSHQWSVEATLSAPADGRKLNWIGGLFAFNEEAREETLVDILLLDLDLINQVGAFIPPQFPLLSNGGVAELEGVSDYNTRSYAAFGEADWQVLDWLTLRAGGRFTYDKKDAVITWRTPDVTSSCAELNVEESWTAFTGKAGLEVRVDDEKMIYGTFSQGFKSGGFNTTACDGMPFNPERVNAFEIGFKSEWWNRRLRLNLSAFQYGFTDIQVQQIDLIITVIANAAEATIRGAELEGQLAIFEWLTLDGSATFLNARYDDYFDDEALTLFVGDIDLSGNRLPKSPTFASNIGLTAFTTLFSDYVLTGRVEWSYKTQQFFTQFNNDANSQKAYHVVNAYVTVAGIEDGLGLQAFVKNLTDTDYKSGGVVASALVGGPVGFYAAPRNWGLELNYRF